MVMQKRVQRFADQSDKRLPCVHDDISLPMESAGNRSERTLASEEIGETPSAPVFVNAAPIPDTSRLKIKRR